jgi:hypothetical protein
MGKGEIFPLIRYPYYSPGPPKAAFLVKAAGLESRELNLPKLVNGAFAHCGKAG